MPAQWLDSEEAARRLGVKPASLYAYVSRGQVRRRTAPDGRRSEYHPTDVAALAVRGRRSRPMQPTDVVVPTAITAITPTGPTYRGVPAVDLAGDASFESVADRLWESPHEPESWHAAAVPDPVAPPPAVDGGFDAGQRLIAAVVALREADPLGRDLRPPVVVATARRLLVALASSLGGPYTAGTPLAETVARSLGTDVDDDGIRAVDAALVLLADHELAASTLAVRVGASARCDPYAAELAGLAVLSGPRHGAASRGLETVLAEVAAGALPASALATVTRDGEAVGGFGHPLYPDGDPRATRLLEILDSGSLASRLVPLHAVLDTADRRGLPPPSIDAALAGLTHAIGAPQGAGEFVFALARTAGWMAHAIEQYAEPLLLRPKAVYIGP